MAGSATLDPDVLVDSLVTGLIDDLRGSLHPEFGVRAFSVYTVLRVWEAGYIGEGAYSETETELTPQPLVLPYHDNLGSELKICGIDETGTVALREISLSHTEAELIGGITDEDDREWFIRLKDAHGQEIQARDFVVRGAPYPDRIKDMGWSMRIERVSD